jgi:ClpX C4-type zinc finger
MIARMKARGLRCSFCGKSRGEVTNIVGGAPHAAKARRGRSPFICNECVRRFNQLIASSEVNCTLVPTSNLK